ncbi:poly(R)-hydroxyalkanoic acid synthase subunit PhaE [Microcoleus sp. herbarium2]|uniref:poly(R)-hydroxyalkanoic acid synthase subunit PhaE n=1 Tax=Microcoleus sp. herbarium2 TaxID=3055433 RepID=UPI002FD2C2BD
MWESWFDFIKSATTPATPAAVKATQNQAELWQIYLKGLQKLTQLWAESLQQSLKSETGAVGGYAGALIELSNLYWNMYGKTFGSVLQSPNLGFAREFNNKLLKSFDAGINFSKANFDYQLLLLDVWLKAFEETMRELAFYEEKGETVQDWQQLLSVWSKAFDGVFLQRLRAEDALEARGNYLNSAMTYRLYQQQVMEVFLKMYDVPTRREVDEVYQNIYELRKELKSLKKVMAESQLKG